MTIHRRHLVSPKATGPRTELGKERSSRNAIRHGILSEAMLLKGESRAQFDSLRTELWEALQPAGRLEELLVDKLASLSWRYGRLLVAETGEIRNQLLEWIEKRDQKIDGAVDSLRDEDRLQSMSTCSADRPKRERTECVVVNRLRRYFQWR